MTQIDTLTTVFAKATTIKTSRFLIILGYFLLGTSFFSCNGQTTTDTQQYTFKEGSYGGIDKWYLGREIAHVMGYQGMSWLERPEREAEEEVTTLLSNMNIKNGDSIADIGAGSGYHVFKMAPKVEEGMIYAVDIQDEMLASMAKKKIAQELDNIVLVKGTEQNVNLPAMGVDKVLMVDVYHEFAYPYEMMQSILKALKPDGKVYLIEYRGEDKSVPIKALHKMTEAQAVKEMAAVGLRLEKNMTNLPWQHCMVFVRK